MDWKDLLSSYLDGELTPEWREKAERILAESARARAWLEEMRRVDRALRQVPDVQDVRAAGVSDDLRQRFAARARRELGISLGTAPAATANLRLVARGGTRRWIIGGSVAAAAALLLAVALGLFNPAAPDGNANPVADDHHNTSPADSPAPVANADTRPPVPDVAAAMPSDEVLGALDLLASDVDFVALAALDQEDIDLLGDTEYLAMLASYDDPGPADTFGD